MKRYKPKTVHYVIEEHKEWKVKTISLHDTTKEEVVWLIKDVYENIQIPKTQIVVYKYNWWKRSGTIHTKLITLSDSLIDKIKWIIL